MSGLPYDPSAPPTNEVYTKLLSLSPIVHAHKVRRERERETEKERKRVRDRERGREGE